MISSHYCLSHSSRTEKGFLPMTRTLSFTHSKTRTPPQAPISLSSLPRIQGAHLPRRFSLCSLFCIYRNVLSQTEHSAQAAVPPVLRGWGGHLHKPHAQTPFTILPSRSKPLLKGHSFQTQHWRELRMPSDNLNYVTSFKMKSREENAAISLVRCDGSQRDLGSKVRPVRSRPCPGG